ncbi:hypothetical protein KEM60_00500 [Austwickia sp. TVS 96-490-7B]|uniref:hypothetical protein n=1 Tax=Austwickia sp. TVS 96-490-7B TaxID=2830843 RepID=UPI001C57A0DD|nr:hypothetical protein [Austwickia sp. TVS 96-490-7B]MBW3084313.1 hypothetical protein [Austwickia sp. TVS 96-490-7B]
MHSFLVGYLALVTILGAGAYVAGCLGWTQLLDHDGGRSSPARDRRFALANLTGAACHVTALFWLTIATRAGYELGSWPVLLGVVPLIICGAIALHTGTAMLQVEQ